LSDVEKLDFSCIENIDKLLKQLHQDITVHKKLHIIRSFAKFRKYFLNRYQVFYTKDKMIVRYVFDGQYNFLIKVHAKDQGTIILNTRDLDDALANVLLDATIWVVRYVESGASFNIYHEARINGFVIQSARGMR
jgi:hypothetical protein